MRTTILAALHAARNMRRDLLTLSLSDWRADYLATAELRAERIEAVR